LSLPLKCRTATDHGSATAEWGTKPRLDIGLVEGLTSIAWQVPARQRNFSKGQELGLSVVGLGRSRRSVRQN
jgi:hypothetical protein